MRMAKSLDLVLLTDEPIEWEGDYWFRASKKAEREMRNLDLTAEDKERVSRQFGVRDYFRLLPPNERRQLRRRAFRVLSDPRASSASSEPM